MTFDDPGSGERRERKKYYKAPILEPWTYVGMGMAELKRRDPGAHSLITAKQRMCGDETRQQEEYVRLVSARLGWPRGKVEAYLEQFLQRFPLALRNEVGWDDTAFIFLYLAARILRPRVIIETGSNVGFSSAFFALALKDNNNGGVFYTIDPGKEYRWDKLAFVTNSRVHKQKIHYERMKGEACAVLGMVPADLRKHIILKKGYSKDVLPRLLADCGPVDIFYHDSDHGYPNMVRECAQALPRVRPGGYVLVHDINLHSAFREMFGRRGGIAIKRNLGFFRKGNGSPAIDGQWTAPADNARRNDSEFDSRRICLESSPKTLVIKISSSCGQKCFLCPSRKARFGGFDDFERHLEGKLARYISQGQKIVFESCSFFGSSREIARMLGWKINCIELGFPEVEKVYFTNGTDLSPRVAEFLCRPGGLCAQYDVRTTVRVSLNASREKLHRALTQSDSFGLVMKNIGHLAKLRAQTGKPRIFLDFTATSLNIDDLPDFVARAPSLGADKVFCRYACFDSPDRQHFSCFFNQALANRMLEKAEKTALKTGIALELPPRFGEKEYPRAGPCPHAWDRMILDARGNLLTCREYLVEGANVREQDFPQVWNGEYYRKLRESLAEGSCECVKYCIESNPSAVNDLRAHVKSGRPLS